jgi:hypothetical protein
MKNWSGGMATAGMAIVLTFLPAYGQDLAGGSDAGATGGRNGFHLYGITGAAGYSTAIGTLGTARQVAGLGGETFALGSVSVGYSHLGPKSDFSLVYVPSYSGQFAFANFSSFNQTLNLSLNRSLSPKWTLATAGTAASGTVTQYLLNEGIASSPLGSLGSTGLLSAGAAVPGAAPLSRALLYGTGLLTFSEQVSFGYRYSTRLHLSFGGQITDSWSRDNGGAPKTKAALPSSLTEQGMADASYALSPRSQIGAGVSIANTRSFLGRYDSASFLGSYGRQIGRRWSVSASAGLGTFTSFGEARSGTVVSFVTAETVQYSRRSQTWNVTYSRMVGDSYGLSAPSTTSWLGTWNWHRPGHSWGLTSSGGLQRFASGPLGNVSIWQASSGISEALGSQAFVTFSYVFLKEAIAPVFGYPNQNLQVVSVSLSWLPSRREARSVMAKFDNRSAADNGRRWND